MAQPNNLYLLDRMDSGGYDKYSSFVACAATEHEARRMHPDDLLDDDNVGIHFSDHWGDSGPCQKQRHADWVLFADVDSLRVVCLGTALPTVPKGVVLAQYTAG